MHVSLPGRAPLKLRHYETRATRARDDVTSFSINQNRAVENLDSTAFGRCREFLEGPPSYPYFSSARYPRGFTSLLLSSAVALLVSALWDLRFEISLLFYSRLFSTLVSSRTSSRFSLPTIRVLPQDPMSPSSPKFDDITPAGSDGPFDMYDQEKQIYQGGIEKFNQLGWKRLTIVLIVEAVALGTLSIPATFAKLGMVAGVICCIGLGLIAVYTSYTIGQVKVKFPHISNYPDAGRQMFGRWGYEIIYVMLCLELLLAAGSHCLTGTIAFANITGSSICSLVFGVVSAIILFIFAIPPSFSEMAILGYVDFASIIIAVGITIIGTGIQTTQSTGFEAVPWSAWPKEGLTFAEAFIALSNIIFAYSFALCQFSFMDEMHTPTDFPKSIWALGLTEISIYTITGALVYAFVGEGVKSPALLSAGSTLSRIAFGIALPVIFISGSINTVVLGRLIHGRIFKDSNIRFVNSKWGWITWLTLIVVLTILEFVVAEVIPFFDDLLSLISSLFVSGFTFYFPAIMWFMYLRSDKLLSPKNLFFTVVNILVFAVGLVVLVAGTYASIVDIVSACHVVLVIQWAQLLTANRSTRMPRVPLEVFSRAARPRHCYARLAPWTDTTVPIPNVTYIECFTTFNIIWPVQQASVINGSSHQGTAWSKIDSKTE